MWVPAVCLSVLAGLIQLRHGVLDRYDWVYWGLKGSPSTMPPSNPEKDEEMQACQSKQDVMTKSVTTLRLSEGRIARMSWV